MDRDGLRRSEKRIAKDRKMQSVIVNVGICPLF